MTEPAPIAPTIGVPLSDAVQELTGFEAMMIERRYDKKLEELGGIALTIGVVYIYENRNGKRAWSSVENMTFRELTGYFAPEPDDIDESDPDSDVGKGDSSGATQTMI